MSYETQPDLEEIRRWLKAKIKQAGGKSWRKAYLAKTFSLQGLANFIDVNQTWINKWANGKPMSEKYKRRLSNFMQEYEAGLIGFEKPEFNKPIRVIRLDKPEKRPVRMSVTIGEGGPRLNLVPVRTRTKMPSIPEISRFLVDKPR